MCKVCKQTFCDDRCPNAPVAASVSGCWPGQFVGYREIGTGLFISERDAYDFVLNQIKNNEEIQQEFKTMLVEWFYSGNWSSEYEIKE